ncbi:MAG: ferredoxin [Acidimicrobiia bacterium]
MSDATAPRAGGLLAVVVDRTICLGTGVCEAIDESLFEVGDDGWAVFVGDPDDYDEAKVQEAVDSCPQGAISLAPRD